MRVAKFIFSVCIVSSFNVSCKDNVADKPVKDTTSTDSSSFYPLNDYLVQQIKSVDSNANIIYKITIMEGHKDSIPISKEEFNIWAKKFIDIDISNPSNKKFYTQNIFLDQTTNSYTFTYKCKRNDMPLQSADVLLDAQTQQVKRVFINKNFYYTDSIITEKMGWKNNSSFFINRIVQLTGKKEFTQQNIIAWRVKD